jgi:hypothetical protein
MQGEPGFANPNPDSAPSFYTLDYINLLCGALQRWMLESGTLPSTDWRAFANTYYHTDWTPDLWMNDAPLTVNTWVRQEGSFARRGRYAIAQWALEWTGAVIVGAPGPVGIAGLPLAPASPIGYSGNRLIRGFNYGDPGTSFGSHDNNLTTALIDLDNWNSNIRLYLVDVDDTPLDATASGKWEGQIIYPIASFDDISTLGVNTPVPP